MLRWIPYTFVRTVLFFIGGITLGYYHPDIIPQGIAIAVTNLLLPVYFLLFRFRRRLRRLINPGMIALPFVFLLGYLHLLLQTESRQEDHLINTTASVTFYRAVVTRFAEEKARSWKVEARVDGIHTTSWEGKHGKLLLYLSKEDFPEPFVYGDVLLIRGQPAIPDPAYNPGQFDYRKYLSLHNIYHQHFIRAGDAVRIGHTPDNILHEFAYRGRSWAEGVLHEYVSGAREQAIASALVLGVTDGLDNELLDAYSATGTMHILAVSGLHISIIYLILLRIGSPLNRFKSGRWAVAFISLAILWLYAIVTGLSPSVLRAVMMFSFFAVARPWARSTNVYNTLAVSAFCLLLFDPFLIFSVGFQLSYLAVLGIVYIYPRILLLWEPRHVFTVEIWKLSAVSIAAQLATFPLGLLYFNQFPNYFMLSNLVVVPLSFVVLIVGLIVIAISFIPLIATWIGFCLEWVIKLINGIVFAMDDLPFAVTDNIYITAWQALLLLLLIGFALVLFEEKRFKYVFGCLSTVLIFTVLQWIHYYRDVDVPHFTVYRIPGHTAIDLIDRGGVWAIADSAVSYNARMIRFHIMPNRIRTGVKNETAQGRIHRFQGGKLIMWKNASILQLTDPNFEVPPGIRVDWLVVGNNGVNNLPEMMERIACRQVILDSSNSFFFATRFLEDAKLHKLEVHSVLHQGAFVDRLENRDS